LARKPQRFLLRGAFLFGTGGGGAARIGRPRIASHAACREQVEQDVVAPLINCPIRGCQAKRIAGVHIGPAIDRITSRRKVATGDGVKQRRRWGKIGVFIRRNGFWRAARGEPWQGGRARRPGTWLTGRCGKLRAGGADIRDQQGHYSQGEQAERNLPRGFSAPDGRRRQLYP